MGTDRAWTGYICEKHGLLSRAATYASGDGLACSYCAGDSLALDASQVREVSVVEEFRLREAEAERDTARKLIERYRRPMVDDGVSPSERLHVLKVRTVDAEARAERLKAKLREARDLLRRLSEWDHMQTAGDGPYWLRAIANLLDTDEARAYADRARGVLEKGDTGREG